jgi:hypothetical protein
MTTHHTSDAPTAQHDIETTRPARSRRWLGPVGVVGVVAFAGVAVVGTALYSDGDGDVSSRPARASNAGDSTRSQVSVRGDPRGPSHLWPTPLVPRSQVPVHGDPRGPSHLWPTPLVPRSQVPVHGDPRGPSHLWPTPLVPRSQVPVHGDPRGPSHLWPTPLVPRSQDTTRHDRARQNERGAVHLTAALLRLGNDLR